ncbi:MAG: nuclease-related domain-containing protein [Patescibacteria group bacterium]|nr:nuclease-related domain-containing protein [Patescibacteria group bacterium]
MKNKKRSPLKSSPLRQAGQSLNEKIEDIINDKILLYIICIFIFVLMTLIEWSRWYFNTPPQPIFWTLITVIISIYFIRRILGYIKEVENCKLGRDGEKIVGESLDKLKEKGYKVFSDIIDERFNIDHILIGPSGVYTIEVKTRSKRMGNPKISYDGVNIKIDGLSPDKNPITQAKSQKYWLKNFILEHTKIKIEVKPVVIYPGWFIKSKSNNAEVWVLNEKAFPTILKKEKSVLSTEQINIIASHIENYNRRKN